MRLSSMTSPTVILVTFLVLASVGSSKANNGDSSTFTVSQDLGFFRHTFEPGHQVSVPCIPTGRRSNIASPRYIWMDTNGRRLNQQGMTVTGTGKLVIAKFLHQHMGNYVCRCTDGQANDDFGHELVVKEKQRPSILTKFLFILDTCNAEETLVPTALFTNHLCGHHTSCPYTISRQCYVSKTRQDRLTFDVYTEVGDAYVKPDSCDDKCNLMNMIDAVIKNYDKVPKMNHVLASRYRQGVTFDISGFRLSWVSSCQSGYSRGGYNVCIPCRPGTYCGKGMYSCKSCPRNTYVHSYGATKCVPCPPGRRTATVGAKHANRCV